MSSVFHYTDTRGLIGILTSKSLYATDYRYLNDASEGSSVRNYIVPIFEAEMIDITNKLAKAGFIDDNFYKELGNRGIQLEAQNHYASFVRAVDNVSPFFVLSFCRHERESYEYKHGLLSQWRGYAENGGVAIEFDEDELDLQARLENQSFEYAGFKSDNVSYYEHQKKIHAHTYAGVAGEITRSIFQGVGLDVSKITGRKDLGEVIKDYAQTAPFLKHESFHEEAEYRIVFVCYRANKIPAGAPRPTKRVEFRRKSGLLVPYIQLFDTKNLFDAIRGVVVGPHPFQDKQEEAVKMLLESKGLKVSVRKSVTSYTM